MKKYFIPLIFALLGCGQHLFDDATDDVFGTGLERGNLEEVPQDVKRFSASNTASLPKSVSLEDKFPPVQSQGKYGTCAVWSTGYAFKTALNAIDKNWKSSDLAKASNQTSPKDLWLSVSSDKRNKDCNGVAMEYAMDVLIEGGAASMADVPYDMSNSCNASSSNAKRDPNNKLGSYRKIAVNYQIMGTGNKIEGMDVDNFKTYLAQGRPISFAAMLGDRFRYWRGSSVLSSDINLTFGHAMVLVGYDDSKGTNGAFRVRNSWGTDWGDKGSIWVDYDFFVNNFCAYAFVAQNPNSNYDDNPSPASKTADLLASYAEDNPDPENPSNPRARMFYYEVYNNGKNPILAKNKWSVYYMYYNAYNAEQYGIIFEDYYTDGYGKPCEKPGDVCWGECKTYTDTKAWICNNMDVMPGAKVGEVAFGETGADIPYEMPNNVNGNYYLLVYADATNVIDESNEGNNVYFITDKGGKPFTFKNGVMQSTTASSATSAILAKRARPAPVHSVVDLGELNAYTPQEIKTLLKRDKESGVLAKKIAQYRETAKPPVKRIRRK